MDTLHTRHHKWLWLTALLVMAGVAAAYFSDNGKTKTQFLTTPVIRGSIENTVLAAGVLQPAEYVDVGAQVSGQLKTLQVKLGDKVSKGQLLAEIDPILSASKVSEAEATLEDLRAQRRARAEQLLLAGRQKKRSDWLIEQDALARSEAEVVDSGYRVAHAAVNSLDAQIKQAQAALATARANLGYTRISAPMDGEVVSISAREGQTLNANQQAPIILRVAKLDTMTVWAQVAEADVARLKVGQGAYFTVLGDSERRRRGKVKQILPAPEIVNNVIFYNALFDVPNPDQELKVQMTAQVFFVLERADDTLIVPAAALVADGKPGQFRVNVLKDDGSVEKRKIGVGIRNAVSAQVLSGLNEGDGVITGEGDGEPKKAEKKSGLKAKKP